MLYFNGIESWKLRKFITNGDIGKEQGKMKKLFLLIACIMFAGLLMSGCGDQTAGNITELTDYGRGMFLDGSDVHSFAR